MDDVYRTRRALEEWNAKYEPLWQRWKAGQYRDYLSTLSYYQLQRELAHVQDWQPDTSRLVMVSEEIARREAEMPVAEWPLAITV